MVGWGQVVDAIMVQVSEVRDHRRGHRYSLVVVEMHFLIQDVLPPVSVSVVGRPAYLPLRHGGAGDPRPGGGLVLIVVVHVYAYPVER